MDNRCLRRSDFCRNFKDREYTCATGYRIVRLVLDDGRELFASPGHPTADGRTLGNLSLGDIVDGAHAVIVEHVPYEETATYDILPSGDTGSYWADGILIGSTLAR